MSLKFNSSSLLFPEKWRFGRRSFPIWEGIRLAPYISGASAIDVISPSSACGATTTVMGMEPQKPQKHAIVMPKSRNTTKNSKWVTKGKWTIWSC